MARPFTDSVVSTLKPQRDQNGWRDIADGGCRGLCLRVSPRGEKVWAVRHMVVGKRERHTIGAYPAVSLAEARRRAGQYLASARDGTGADAFDAKLRALSLTVAQAHAEYLETLASTIRTGTRKMKQGLFRDHIGPVIGARPIGSIRRANVVEVVEAVRHEYPVQANRAFSEVMALLRWCEQHGYVEGVPSVRKREVGTREQPRRRTLTEAEIGELWREAGGLGATTRDFLRLLLLTGQRRDEVRSMRWAEVDLGQALWTIPGSHYKTGVPHVVPLSEPALEILRARWSEGAAGFVLAANGQNKPFNGAASAMRRLRAKLTGKGDYTLHDLRRTLRTGLSRLGVDDMTAELVIGHMPQGMRKVYDQHDRLDERRHALKRWAEYVLRLASGDSNVVTMTREARA